MFKYHKTQFVTEFSNYYRRCADLLRSHENVVKTSLFAWNNFGRIQFILYTLLNSTGKKCFCRKNKVFLGGKGKWKGGYWTWKLE